MRLIHTDNMQQGTVVIRHSALLLLCLFELGAAGDGQRVREGENERIPFLNPDEHRVAVIAVLELVELGRVTVCWVIHRPKRDNAKFILGSCRG